MSWSWQLETKGLLRILRPLVDLIGRDKKNASGPGLKELLERTKAELSKQSPNDLPDALDDRNDGLRRRRRRRLSLQWEHRLGALGANRLRNDGERSTRF